MYFYLNFTFISLGTLRFIGRISVFLFMSQGIHFVMSEGLGPMDGPMC